MNERLLQFLWKFQYFNHQELSTISGVPLRILHPGIQNHNQGPDFTDARIGLETLQLAGTVELHIKTSDWNAHGHTGDPHYNNVILHVVWEHDAEVPNQLPVLELRNRIPSSLLSIYTQFMERPASIPCASQLNVVTELTWQSWKERMVTERFLMRMQWLEQQLQRTNGHWEEAFWRLLARNFGLPLNTDVFEAIAVSLPVTVLARHKNQIHQLEALLLGQAGLLEETFSDNYALLLQKEYRFLQKKYQLKPVKQLLNFLRMRPSNFPTVRLAQLAMLIHQSNHLFSKVKEAKSLDEMRNYFQVTANDFWHRHYLLTEESAYRKKQVGLQMIDNLLINTVLPALFTFGHRNTDAQLQQQVLHWLSELPKERNTITSAWEQTGVAHHNAFDSQALLQLQKNYCNQRMCLSCAIGNSILKKSMITS
jgi:hypothetical protein